MGDHFNLLVDRLITESTLEAAIESRKRSMQAASSAVNDTEVNPSLMKVGVDDIKCPGKLVECRICHDDDEDSNMETPCSCCGSLKYAHRKCIQRWCNEKGDTTCEICHQQFKPGYTAPPPLFQFGRIPMSFRGNWEISRRDLNSTHLVSMVPTDQNLTNSNYDQYSASTSGSFICCRSVAIIFMVLLILRHALPLVISGNKEVSFPLFMLLLFRIAGIVLPIYFVVRAVMLIQRHRRQHREHPNALVNLSDDENEQAALQPPPHVIHLL
ncbi:Zinc finger, RING-CH-type [Sesbania bispinosa]|nr:Zinc finger, RING-CH-type [Sesbania bispinosa]